MPHRRLFSFRSPYSGEFMIPGQMASPRHKPYRTAAAAFEIGLRPMDMADWLEVETDHAAFMAAKRTRLEGRPPMYYRSLPRSLAAQSELLRTAVACLLAHHGDVYRAEGEIVLDGLDGSRHDLSAPGREPLEILGDLLEEDFMLFEKEDGRDIVSAASNAYTSSGRIAFSVGSGLHVIHEPVPGLNEALGARIDRVIGNIKPGRPVARFNWFLTAVPDRLHPPDYAALAARVAAALEQDFHRAGELLWLRVEQQTFLRLAETGALASGVHTYSHPLSALGEDGESLAALHRLLGEYTAERLDYAGMRGFRDAVRRWAEVRLG